MKGRKLLSGFLALSIVTSAMSTGAFAAAGDPSAADASQSASAPETIYVSQFGGGERSSLMSENWKFFYGEAASAEQTTFNDSAWRTVNLPHDYSIEQEFTKSGEAESGYLPGGTGWYRKSFSLDSTLQGKVLSVDFGGVYMNSTVYLNGHQLGTHPYGYTPFSFVLPAEYLDFNGENTIAVKVENKTPSSRWYSGSGIYRDVYLTATDPVHVARYGTTVTTANSGEVNVTAEVENDGAESAEVTVKTSVFAADSDTAVTSAAASPVTVAADASQKIVSSLNVADPALWSTTDPNMYSVRTEVVVGGVTVDSYDTDFGFREFAFNHDTGFSLNGENLKLQGMCMHHDQGALGAEAWYRATERQVEILQDMGCNAIRVTHNPASDALIDICNKKGMLLIDEAFDTWTNPKNGNTHDFSEWFTKTISADNAIVGGEAGMQWSEFDVKAMVERDKNAPSVIMYSLGNEIFEGISGDSSNYPTIAQNLIDWIKEVDTTRPTTIGDNRRATSGTPGAVNKIIADEGGVVGYNYSNPSQITAGNNMGWNMYGSENASAVNSRGVYNFKGGSVQTGNKKLTSYDKSAVGWGAVASDAWYRTIPYDYNAGEFVWTGFDYIGEPTPWNGTGSGAVGSWPSPKSSYFGVIDTNGLPKDTYYFYQSQWDDSVNTLHVLPTWDEADVVKDSSGNVEVVVYSDAATVKLYLNDVEVGTAATTDITTDAGHTYRTFTSGTGAYAQKSGHQSMYATFSVPYAAGTLSAKAFDAAGNEITDTVGRASVSTTSTKTALTADADSSSITADGRDLSYVTIDVTDASGNIVNGAADLINIAVSGNGTLVGLDNGVQADHTSYQAASREAGAGQLVAIVQSTKDAGSFTLTATADGLTAATATVTTTAAAGETEKTPASYEISKNYYVKLGATPSLPSTITVTYSDGTVTEEAVAWDAIDPAKLNTVGSFAATGKITGPNIPVSVNINILEEVASLLNYAAAIPVGGTPSLPASRPIVLADGSVLTAQFPVDWDMPDAASFAQPGTVIVNGTSSAFGKEVKVTASIRVAEGDVTIGGNVAANAAELTQNIPAASQSDTLEAVRDGATEIDANPSGGPNPSAWSNYAWAQAGNNTASLTYRYDTAQNLGQASLYFFTDTFATALPDGVKFEWSPDGINWNEINATAGEDTTPSSRVTKRTYSFTPVPAVLLRVTFTDKAGDAYGHADRKYCTGLTEIELNVATTDFAVNSSAALSEIKVNGTAADAASLAAHEYPTQALYANEVTAKSADNASFTILPVQDNVIRILTESEDHAASGEYRILLAQDTTGTTDPEDASRDYDYTKTTASAGSQQPSGSPEGPAALAVDGDAGTWWHSRWSAPADDLRNQPEKRYFQLTLADETTIDGLRYLPRPTVANGIVTEYRVETSVDGEAFTPAATGTWAHDTVWKNASFAPVSAKYVRLYGVETRGGAGDNPNQFMSAAEVRVCVASADAKTDLSAAAVTLESTAIDYTGTAIEPKPTTVTLDGKELVYGVDYLLSYENNTNPGTATVKVNGIVGYLGTASATFTINSVDTTITGFAPLSAVTTLNGIAPTLPETVTAHWDVGPDTQETVVWDAIDSAKYTDPTEKTFTVEGTVANATTKPSVSVKVIKGMSAEAVAVSTSTGTNPVLPAQITVTFDDASTRLMDVQWAAFTDGQFDNAGDVTVSGTVQVGGDTLSVTATVTVIAGTPTGNLALNEGKTGLPLAMAWVSSPGDNPFNAADGKHPFNGADGKKIWSDWERNTYHDAPWLGMILGEGDAVQTKLLNKISIGFVTETSGAVTYPTAYQVQVYTGPEGYAYDSTLTVPNSSTGNGFVRGWAEGNPLKDDANWTNVTLSGEQPAAKAGEMLDVSFEPVRASALRVVFTPQENHWVGVDELEVYGLDTNLHGDFEVTSIKLGDTEKLDAFDDSHHLAVALGANDEIPQLSATATNNARIAVKQAASKTDTATVTFTPEDGNAENAVTYTVQFSETATPPSGDSYAVSSDTLANGTVGTDKSTAKAGDTVAITVTPKTGYQLKADSLKAYKTGDETTTVAITGNTFVMPAYAVTVSAELEAISYTITYDLAGGKLAEGESNPANYTVEDGAITLVNPTKENASFSGWLGAGLLDPTKDVVIPAGSTGNRTYTAVWSTESSMLEVQVLGARRVALEDPVVFQLALANMERVSVAQFDFDVNDTVKGGTPEALEDFMVLPYNADGSAIKWQKNEDGTRHGTLVLGHPNGGMTVKELTSIVDVTFQNKRKTGTASLTLTGVQIVGYDEDNKSVVLQSSVVKDKAETVIGDRYDVTEDGKVDLLDLSYALTFYQDTKDSANWNEASICDVNGDGVVNMDDLILIYKHFTKE